MWTCSHFFTITWTKRTEYSSTSISKGNGLIVVKFNNPGVEKEVLGLMAILFKNTELFKKFHEKPDMLSYFGFKRPTFF